MRSFRVLAIGAACLCLVSSDALARGGRGRRGPSPAGSRSVSSPTRSGGHTLPSKVPGSGISGISPSGHPGSLATPLLGTRGLGSGMQPGSAGVGPHPTRSQLGNFLTQPNGPRPFDVAGPRGNLHRPNAGTLTDHVDVNRIRDRWQNLSTENRPFDSNWWDQHVAAVGQLPAWHYWNNPAWVHPGQPNYWWHGATAVAVTGWVAFNWAKPAYYNYGDNVYYLDGSVYVDGQPVATTEQYYQQATGIVSAAPELDQAAAAAVQWMPLGVFAVAEAEAATSDTLMQLAVSKEGVISGTFYQRLTGITRPLQGAVDKDSQRAVWSFADGQNTDVVMEAGIFNLTEQHCKVLVHHGVRETQTYVLVRLAAPDSDSSASPVR